VVTRNIHGNRLA